MLGGVTATLSGGAPYGSGLEVRMSVTARGVPDGSPGARPGFGSLELTELSFSTDRALGDGERVQVQGFVTVLGHHLASFLLNDAAPALPLASLEPPTELRFEGGSTVPTGVTGGTRLGSQAPVIVISGDHFEAAGAFGELAP